MERIWLKNYQSGVPADINPDLDKSLVEMFEKTCQKYSDKPAFANRGEILTFKALEEKSNKMAFFFQSLGLKKGDRVALMMPNLLQHPVTMFGILRAGLVVVNVNPLYTARELEDQLQDSGALAIVVLENFAHTVQAVLKNTTIKHVIVTKVGDLFSWPKSIIVNSVVKYIKQMVPSWDIPGFISFHEALQKGGKEKFQKPTIESDDLAFLQYTGGTTSSRAKGAMLTHGNMVANLEQASLWILPIIKPGEEIIITALPLYHIFSLMANCFTFMKIGGLNVLITNPRDIKTFIKELRRQPFTVMTGVNTLFNALLNQPEFEKLDFSFLRLCLGGGMAVQKGVAERWKKTTGCALLEAYGLTEACPAVCINPMNLVEYNGSIGLPISSTEVSIRDDQNRELPIGEPGELWIRGPQVMKGYWNKPEETKETLVNGWLRSGDIATIDKEGYVKIIDRKKDMILVSGFNVNPSEVEDVIALMSAVKEVAVVGILDKERGEKVKAFIVKKEEVLTSEAVIEHCKKQLAAYKIPKEIEFRKELPKTAVGKILRRVLREGK